MIIYFIIALVIQASSNRKDQNQKLKLNELALKNLEGFNAEHQLVTAWGFMAIDVERGKFAIKTASTGVQTFNFHEIESYEILEDDSITYRTNTSQVIKGTIAGKIIGGNVGAFIGGTMADLEEIRNVKTLDVRLRVIKDETTEELTLRTFDAWEETGQLKKKINYKDSIPWENYTKALMKSLEWNDLIAIITARDEDLILDYND